MTTSRKKDVSWAAAIILYGVILMLFYVWLPTL